MENTRQPLARINPLADEATDDRSMQAKERFAAFIDALCDLYEKLAAEDRLPPNVTKPYDVLD